MRGRSASATTPAPPAAAEHARRGSGGLPPPGVGRRSAAGRAGAAAGGGTAGEAGGPPSVPMASAGPRGGAGLLVAIGGGSRSSSSSPAWAPPGHAGHPTQSNSGALPRQRQASIRITPTDGHLPLGHRGRLVATDRAARRGRAGCAAIPAASPSPRRAGDRAGQQSRHHHRERPWSHRRRRGSGARNPSPPIPPPADTQRGDDGRGRQHRHPHERDNSAVVPIPLHWSQWPHHRDTVGAKRVTPHHLGVARLTVRGPDGLAVRALVRVVATVPTSVGSATRGPAAHARWRRWDGSAPRSTPALAPPSRSEA